MMNSPLTRKGVLKELARVQSTAVSLGGQQRTWYLDVTDIIRNVFRKRDMRDLLM